MKTLVQIHKDHRIAKSTLRHRFDRFGFNTKMSLTPEQELLVVKRIYTPTTKLLKKVSPILVFNFKCENPYMSNDEIAGCLAVPRHLIDEILQGEYFIISSKSNKWH